MHWLEKRFRRRFEPHGDGYRFRQVDREVIFDREEVELLVADWRRYWFSPWLWGALLLLFVAPLAAMQLWRPEGYEAFFIIVPTVTLVSCLAALWVAWRGPDEAAFKFESVGPGRGRSGYGSDVFGIVIALFWIGTYRPSAVFGNWFYWFWVVFLLFSIARLAHSIWKRRRAAATA